MSKCLGCGITLQTENPDFLGYTTNIESKICTRCFRIKHYGEYKEVLLTNKDYQSIIDNIPRDCLIVYLADLLSLNLDNMPKRDNIILVLSKFDILPKSTKPEKIIAKLKKQYPNILDILIISSLKNYQIDTLYNKLIKYHNNKPIYLIGNTNSGKSTLLNKLIKNYSDNQTPDITISMYPSTTLDKVEITLNKIKIIDTPGLIEEGSYLNIVDKQTLKKITPKKEIKPKSCQITNTGSILIDNLARIDYNTKEPNSIVIYTSPNIKSNFISERNPILKTQVKHKYSIKENKDIVLSGLGFIKCTKPLEVTIYTKDNITPRIRNNLI